MLLLVSRFPSLNFCCPVNFKSSLLLLFFFFFCTRARVNVPACLCARARGADRSQGNLQLYLSKPTLIPKSQSSRSACELSSSTPFIFQLSLYFFLWRRCHRSHRSFFTDVRAPAPAASSLTHPSFLPSFLLAPFFSPFLTCSTPPLHLNFKWRRTLLSLTILITPTSFMYVSK